MTRAIAYTRVSTEEQGRDGISMDMQAAKARAYADLNDLDLVMIIEDRGISAKNIKARPGIQEVLRLVKARQIDAVIVYKLDRLARNTIECLEIAQTMDKHGVALHSITEKLDTTSAMGKFFFSLTASLAEMERNIISERTSAALAHKRARGEKTGGFVPFGFESNEGRLIPCPTEQRIINRIRDLNRNGFSTREIAATLNSEQTYTRRGTPW
ncbi:MAG: recombinase family protein, partial [Deltaproteobacteria bacterium]|nr:recombinase family protein [Deltaproteobacteria bacterium]